MRRHEGGNGDFRQIWVKRRALLSSNASGTKTVGVVLWVHWNQIQRLLSPVDKWFWSGPNWSHRQYPTSIRSAQRSAFQFNKANFPMREQPGYWILESSRSKKGREKSKCQMMTIVFTRNCLRIALLKCHFDI